MIGSGFSRCAGNILPDAPPPPLLKDLMGEFSKKLMRSGLDHCGEKLTAANFPKVAQDFEKMFGRGYMNRFLRRLIRDDDLVPRGMHRRLLRLPWRDIFTTNWDTLLERSRSGLPNAKFEIVRNKDDIPLVDGPRIIKLHGSLPSHFPLIATEKDYRDYRTHSGPFVNMVQQAMMETTFCLIGFSGDDPNFQNWAKWVHDNLGESAPNIYIAGWLDISHQQEHLLEFPNVVPIDLARHPNARTWPESRRYDYAIDWVLHSLERGRPYDMVSWPKKQKWKYRPPQPVLEPLVPISLKGTRNASAELKNAALKNGPTKVELILEIWAHNRSLYPGWLAIPGSARRHAMSTETDEWEALIIETVANFDPVQRLNAIRELVWRREVLLDPLSSELCSASETVLQVIDCESRSTAGNADGGVSWGEVRRAWITIALALVTEARHRCDHAVFEARIQALSPFLHDNPDITQRIHHERCLGAAFSLDFQKLPELLRDWQTENCDPMWMVRKAAIHYETNQTDDALRLLDQAYTRIRTMPADNHSVAGPSREGWALFLKWSIEHDVFLADDSKGWPDHEIYLRRWRELAIWECNALAEKDSYTREKKQKEKDAPSFSLDDQQPRRFTLGRGNYNQWVAARRQVRLAEVAGLPVTDSDILKSTADQLPMLSISELELAARLALRSCDYDEDPVLKRVFSRFHVARMEAQVVDSLVETCERVINHAPQVWVSEAGGRAPFWLDRARVAMEGLSRLAIRLSPDRVETMFTQALEWYENNMGAGSGVLGWPIRNMLKNTWESLPERRRARRVFDILNSPIVGLEPCPDTYKNYPDPSFLLNKDSPAPTRDGGDADRWRDLIDRLVRCLEAGGQARERASHRILCLSNSNSLSRSEIDRIAPALWKHVDDNGHLPIGTPICDWEFCLLPEPEAGEAERGFRQKWIAGKNNLHDNWSTASDVLSEVGWAISGLAKREVSLEMSTQEQSYLVAAVARWLDTPIPPIPDRSIDSTSPSPLSSLSLYSAESNNLHRAAKMLPFIFSVIEMPPQLTEKLYEKLGTLRDKGIIGHESVVCFASSCPDRLEEITSWMRVGLASDNSDIAVKATIGLLSWLEEARCSTITIPAPPEDLVHEIGVIVATRRKASLEQALVVAKWIFDDGNQDQQNSVREMVLRGFSYLYEELRYDANSVRALEWEPETNPVARNDWETPRLRWRCVQLAASMANSGIKDAPIVNRWLTAAETDPLPETRQIASTLN